MSSNQKQHKGNTQKRLNTLKRNLRNTLEQVFNFPLSGDSELVWHHQIKTAKNRKISSYKNFLSATKEIINGNCIPLTKEEHQKLHRLNGNIPIPINNNINKANSPFFILSQWQIEISKV